MARITVEDCLEKVASRFELVIVAAKRARDLSLHSAPSQLDWENDKPTVLALREIAAGLVDRTILDNKANEFSADDLEDEIAIAKANLENVGNTKSDNGTGESDFEAGDNVGNVASGDDLDNIGNVAPAEHASGFQIEPIDTADDEDEQS